MLLFDFQECVSSLSLPARRCQYKTIQIVYFFEPRIILYARSIVYSIPRAQTQTDNKTSPSCPTAHITYSRNLCYCISCPALFFSCVCTMHAVCTSQCLQRIKTMHVCARVLSMRRSMQSWTRSKSNRQPSTFVHVAFCQFTGWAMSYDIGPLLFLTFAPACNAIAATQHKLFACAILFASIFSGISLRYSRLRYSPNNCAIILILMLRLLFEHVHIKNMTWDRRYNESF